MEPLGLLYRDFRWFGLHILDDGRSIGVNEERDNRVQSSKNLESG